MKWHGPDTHQIYPPKRPRRRWPGVLFLVMGIGLLLGVLMLCRWP